MMTPNIKHLWRNWFKLEANDWPKFQEHLKKLHSAEFYQAPAQQQVTNEKRSNVVVQTKTHVGSITPTQTTPKSAKSPSKQPLHKAPIRPPKSIKDRLKNLSPKRPERLKQKSQLPISQTTKIQMNTKVNKEKPGSTFKMPSTTKSPITKPSNSQPPAKPLQRTYSIESMDNDTDRVVASLNLDEIIKNYDTWNHFTAGKLISSITYAKLNYFRYNCFWHCIYTKLNCLSKLFWHLTVCKQNLYLYLTELAKLELLD